MFSTLFNFLTSFGAILVICFTIYKLFELFVRRRERLLFLEKLSEIPIEKLKFRDNYPSLDSSHRKKEGDSARFAVLRVSLLILGIGLGLLIAYFVVSTILVDTVYHVDAHRTLKRIIVNSVEVVYGASLLFFGGIGLLFSFIIEQKIRRSGRKNTTTSENE